jgi:hypothetical protein
MVEPGRRAREGVRERRELGQIGRTDEATILIVPAPVPHTWSKATLATVVRPAAAASPAARSVECHGDQEAAARTSRTEKIAFRRSCADVTRGPTYSQIGSTTPRGGPHAVESRTSPRVGAVAAIRRADTHELRS